MPIIWRYLLSQYLKVLLLSVLSFIGILLVTRLDEIAHFAALGGAGKLVFLFTLHQLPYILPIAIPISGLISAIILYQRLSDCHELTALRASGMSVRVITAPTLLAAALMAIISFWIVSEVATESHLATRRLEQKIRTINPLLLLQNRQLLKMKGAWVDVLGPYHAGESASDIVFAINNQNSRRINLLVAKRLRSSRDDLKGSQITFISTLNSEQRNDFDHLVVENVSAMSTPISEFAEIMRKKGWRLSNDHLRLQLLILRLREYFTEYGSLKGEGAEPELVDDAKKRLHACYSEFTRRFSLSFAAFSFTLMGIAFGVSIGRRRSSKGVISVVGLAALYMAAFFFAKGLDHSFYLASSLYILPHFVIVGLSVWTLKAVSRGIE